MQNKGFTLPELLLTTAILGFALSVMLVMFIKSSRLQEECRNLTIAVSHSEFILEGIKNLSFATIPTQINAGTWSWSTATISSNGLNPLKNESIVTSTSGTNPVSVNVTVNWTDSSGRSRSRSIGTLISG